jgi:hypothetical protein
VDLTAVEPAAKTPAKRRRTKVAAAEA